MRVISERFPVDELVTRLRHSYKTGTLTCAGVNVDVGDAVRSWSFERHPSDRWFSRWPCTIATTVSRTQRDGWVGPFAAVVNGQTLFFPDGFEVIRYATSFPTFNGARDARTWGISVITEDHRGRISTIEQQEDAIRIAIDGHARDQLTFSGQLVDTKGEVHRLSMTARSEIFIPVSRWPVNLAAAIVGDGCEIIDTRAARAHGPLPFEPEGIEGDIDVTEQLRAMLRDGENAKCEFKPWLEPSPAHAKFGEVVATVVAMANSDGGSVIIGVDDHGVVQPPSGKVLGRLRSSATEMIAADDDSDTLDRLLLECKTVELYGRKVRDEIQKAVEPSVDLVLDPVVLGETPVLIIVVMPGADTPYMAVEGSRIFVRRNATNRAPTREELRLLHRAELPNQ